MQFYCSEALSVLYNLCQCYSYSVKASVLPSGNLVETLKGCQHNLYLNMETIIPFSNVHKSLVYNKYLVHNMIARNFLHYFDRAHADQVAIHCVSSPMGILPTGIVGYTNIFVLFI